MLCKIWGFHGSDYEGCRILGYKTPVRTSQETHYVSATELSQLMLCKIWSFHGSDYEECRLLVYKPPVRTSQETHYVSATESSRLKIVRFEVFTAVTMKNAVYWGCTPRWRQTYKMTLSSSVHWLPTNLPDSPTYPICFLPNRKWGPTYPLYQRTTLDRIVRLQSNRLVTKCERSTRIFTSLLQTRPLNR
jgi:hypothetical protein